MPPAEFVTVIPVPAVSVVATGAEPVEPTSICPFVNAPASTIAPPLDTIKRLLLSAVDEFVPPFAIGSVPEISVVATTCPLDKTPLALFFTIPAEENGVTVGAEPNVFAPLIVDAPSLITKLAFEPASGMVYERSAVRFADVIVAFLLVA